MFRGYTVLISPRMHLSMDLLLLDILIFVKIKKEINSFCFTESWNASAEGTCTNLKKA